MAVWTKRGKVVDLIVWWTFIDMVKLDERSLANAAAIVWSTQNLSLEFFMHCRLIPTFNPQPRRDVSPRETDPSYLSRRLPLPMILHRRCFFRLYCFAKPPIKGMPRPSTGLALLMSRVKASHRITFWRICGSTFPLQTAPARIKNEESSHEMRLPARWPEARSRKHSA